MIRSEFIAAIKQVATERGITPDDVLETLERAILAAYKKDYQNELVVTDEDVDPTEGITVNIDKETGEVTLTREGKDITPPGFGRIAAQTAKQVILQGVREAEKHAVVDEFRGKLGRVVPGMLQRFDRGRWYVDVGRTTAIMGREDQVYSEEYHPNQRLKVYVREIVEDEIHPEILVSRTDPSLVKGLFVLEVPELQSGAVEIMGIAREPGSRTKIAVRSTQDGVDPVGSMVGQRGVRVQSVTNELQGEKMDIILYSDSLERYIINALSPAHVTDITMNTEQMYATVVVDEDQLSLAIGKDGQNVRLASKLTGYKIDIVNDSGEFVSVAVSHKKDISDLGISKETIELLKANGFDTPEKIYAATDDELSEIEELTDDMKREIESAREEAIGQETTTSTEVTDAIEEPEDTESPKDTEEESSDKK